MTITTTIVIATGSAVAGFVFSRVLDGIRIKEISSAYETIIKCERKKHQIRERIILKAINDNQRAKAIRPTPKPKNTDEAFFSDITSWSIDVNDNDLFGGF